MFVLIRKRRNVRDKIIFEDSDFNKCVQKRQQKMSGANPDDEFTIYRKTDYENQLAEQEEKANRYNEWNKKRKSRYESRRKSSTQRAQ